MQYVTKYETLWSVAVCNSGDTGGLSENFMLPCSFMYNGKYTLIRLRKNTQIYTKNTQKSQRFMGMNEKEGQ